MFNENMRRFAVAIFLIPLLVWGQLYVDPTTRKMRIRNADDADSSIVAGTAYTASGAIADSLAALLSRLGAKQDTTTAQVLSDTTWDATQYWTDLYFTRDADSSTWNATRTWVAAQGFLTAETGDISAVTAGRGITGGGTSGSVTVGLDTTEAYTWGGAMTFSGNCVNTAYPWADNEVASSATWNNRLDSALIVTWPDSANELATNYDLSLKQTAEATLTDIADGTIAENLVNTANPWDVNEGGTGTNTLTDGGILLGSGTGAITPLGVATNGQIPIGDGTTDPVLATISGTTGVITISNGAGTITINGDTSATGNVATKYENSPERFHDFPFYASDFFIAGNNNNAPFLGAAGSSGTVAAPATAQQSGGHPGIVVLKCATGANSGYAYATDAGIFAASGMCMESIVNFVNIDSIQYHFGLHDGNYATDGTDGVFFKLLGDSLLKGVTTNNSSATTTASSYTIADSTWYTLQWRINSNASKCYFRAWNDAGTLLWFDSTASNIPTGRDASLRTIVSWSGATSAKDLILLDYMAWWIETTALAR